MSFDGGRLLAVPERLLRRDSVAMRSTTIDIVQVITSLDNEAAGTTPWGRRLVEELRKRDVVVDVLAWLQRRHRHNSRGFRSILRTDPAFQSSRRCSGRAR